MIRVHLLHMPRNIVVPREILPTDLTISINFWDLVLLRIVFVSGPVVAVHIPLISFALAAVVAGTALDGLFVVFHVLSEEVSES